ncbi:MAG: glycosyltransferase family 2 protein, partial [Solobacterium sp.]|nr:glycosyltransferase family 2 protein [Solobacterium sp.]
MSWYIYSVIIPAFNAEKTIARCLDSLVSQLTGAEEIIVVDDGSADATVQVVDEYAGRYPDIRLIRKRNGGPSSARNAGILAAKGDYILFADSDDFVMPHYFETLN